MSYVVQNKTSKFYIGVPFDMGNGNKLWPMMDHLKDAQTFPDRKAGKEVIRLFVKNHNRNYPPDGPLRHRRQSADDYTFVRLDVESTMPTVAEKPQANKLGYKKQSGW